MSTKSGEYTKGRSYIDDAGNENCKWNLKRFQSNILLCHWRIERLQTSEFR